MSNANPPGIHPILERVLSGHPQDGLEYFQGIQDPDPEAECWAGYCLVILDRPLEGLEWLTRSRTRGFEDAGAFVTVTYRVLGDTERAQSVLNSLETSRMSRLGLAAAERERGALEHTRGHRLEAISAFERGYELASGDPIGNRALAWFAEPLGRLFAEVGRDQQALVYLNRAVSLGGQNAPTLRVSRAVCLARMGRFDEAHQDLETAERGGDGQIPTPATLKYAQGVLASLRGLNEAAANAHLEALALARNAGDAQVEFYSSLHLASVATVDESFAMARAHLNRARALAQGVKMHAHLALRNGALLVRTGPAEGLISLETALRGFESLDLEREIGLTHLHLAEAHLRQDQTQAAVTHLVRVVDARHALGNGTVFAAELRGLPAVFEHLGTITGKGNYLLTLLEDWRALEQHGPSQVTLTTLGSYGITVDGKPIRVNTGLPRTVETLAYLLDKGEATLEQIQHDVFTEVGPQNARAYVHLVKQLVTKAIPGLSVPFSKETRTYSVKHPSLRVYWDALEVKRALGVGGELGVRKALALYTGPFLPKSEGAWAEEFRRDLEWSVAKAGLHALEDLFKLERYETCVELAERLLEINPLEVSVSVLLVQATKELSGVIAARSTLERLAMRFRSEIGEVPEALEALRSSAWLMAN